MLPSLSFLILIMLLLPAQVQAKAKAEIAILLHWEGRQLQEPNLEAIAAFRQAHPDIPFTHLINPVYQSEEASKKNFSVAVGRLIEANDEVGLYLSAHQKLLRQTQVIYKSRPSFWSNQDEADLCGDDCGLDVPLTVYTREEQFQILALSHRSLQEAGFLNPKSYAVRGFMEAPFLRSMAAAFGYEIDLTPIDSELIQSKLSEFPLAHWLEFLGASAMRAEKSAFAVKSINGGILDLNDLKDILVRFERQVMRAEGGVSGAQPFIVSLSLENGFQAIPRLRMLRESLQGMASQAGFELRYLTLSGEKNGRPTLKNVALSPGM